MARLTTRPSIASTRLTSATPDPHFDQENMDPDARPQEKGKQRASDLPTPPSRDDHILEVRGSKRKRVVNETVSEDVDEDDEEFTRYFDPNQDPEERRENKRQFRELEREFLEKRDELKNDDGSRLTETIRQADEIFKNVKQTGDACPDSKLLVNVGDMAYKRSAALITDDKSIGVDVDEFLSKCIAYMRHPAASQRQTQTSQDDDELEGPGPLDWDHLGRHACYPYNARPPVPSFLLGPLSREKKQRAPTQRRARQEKDNARESRPEALTSQDMTQSDQNSLTAQCTQIRKHLKARIRQAVVAVHSEGFDSPEAASTARGQEVFKEHGLRQCGGLPGVPLFEYVINPHSFGQTVENLFYVSFLIKEGSAGLGLDREDLPVLHIANAHSVEEQRAKKISKHQAVLSLDYKTWQDLVKAYSLKESAIPHRDETQETQIGSRGWYS